MRVLDEEPEMETDVSTVCPGPSSPTYERANPRNRGRSHMASESRAEASRVPWVPQSPQGVW